MSRLEEAFLEILQAEADRQGMALTLPEREYRFHPTRKWRFDFAWPEQRLAVEIDGGTWVRGRHVSGGGSHNDRDKRNAAQLAGWRVLAFDAGHLSDDPRDVFLQVMEGLGAFR